MKPEIARWRRNRLATSLYIEAWEHLLIAAPEAILRAFKSGYGGLTPAALAANSPFLAHAPRAVDEDARAARKRRKP